MIIFRDFPSTPQSEGIQHICIGFFDGLHRGHLRVIYAFGGVESLSRSCLVTFWPHPQSILLPDSAPRLLMSLEQKIDCLEDIGFSHTLIIPFDPGFAQKSADQFLSLLRAGFPDLQHLSVGMNFRFGRKREGTPDLLRSWCLEHGIQFCCPELVLHDGEPVSSSRIREAVRDGRLSEATKLLGHPHELFGKVIRGDGRGRLLGFPTANLHTDDILLPPDGVYAGTAILDDRSYACAINIGPRPTVDTTTTLQSSKIEVHLLDFDKNIYGRTLKIRPEVKLREQIKFDSTRKLSEQIRHDIESVRQSRNMP